jgi:hypothetical protein
MSDERKLILFCLAIVLSGVLTVATVVVPKWIEESKLPVTNVNF